MTQPAPPYSPRVLALFSELAAGGPLPAGEGRVVAGEAAALERGAWVRLEVRVVHDQVTAAGFCAWGCPELLAAAAVAADRLKGCLIGAPAAFDARALARELGVPAEKLGRLLVIEDAWRELWSAARALQ